MNTCRIREMVTRTYESAQVSSPAVPRSGSREVRISLIVGLDQGVLVNNPLFWSGYVASLPIIICVDAE